MCSIKDRHLHYSCTQLQGYSTFQEAKAAAGAVAAQPSQNAEMVSAAPKKPNAKMASAEKEKERY